MDWKPTLNHAYHAPKPCAALKYSHDVDFFHLLRAEIRPLVPVLVLPLWSVVIAPDPLLGWRAVAFVHVDLFLSLC